MPPKGTDLVLSSDIPDSEGDVLVFHSLNVKACMHYASGRGNAEIQLYSPIVGMVVTISPNFSLYRMVVLPAASSPT